MLAVDVRIARATDAPLTVDAEAVIVDVDRARRMAPYPRPGIGAGQANPLTSLLHRS
jgi:hypothetical protein